MLADYLKFLAVVLPVLFVASALFEHVCLRKQMGRKCPSRPTKRSARPPSNISRVRSAPSANGR